MINPDQVLRWAWHQACASKKNTKNKQTGTVDISDYVIVLRHSFPFLETLLLFYFVTMASGDQH